MDTLKLLEKVQYGSRKLRVWALECDRAGVQIPAVPLVNCVTLGKLPILGFLISKWGLTVLIYLEGCFGN